LEYEYEWELECEYTYGINMIDTLVSSIKSTTSIGKAKGVGSIDVVGETKSIDVVGPTGSIIDPEKSIYPYLAGFLDGDGSIFCRIVSRPDYQKLFQLSPGISFHQRKSRRHHLVWIAQKLGIKADQVRDRGDGLCELTIAGKQKCESVLKSLLPYLRIKHKQGILLLRLLESMNHKGFKSSSNEDFLKLCQLTDRIAELNDSKNRQHTSTTVRKVYLEKKWINE